MAEPADVCCDSGAEEARAINACSLQLHRPRRLFKICGFSGVASSLCALGSCLAPRHRRTPASRTAGEATLAPVLADGHRVPNSRRLGLARRAQLPLGDWPPAPDVRRKTKCRFRVGCKPEWQVWIASAGGTSSEMLRAWVAKLGMQTGDDKGKSGWMVHSLAPHVSNPRYVHEPLREDIQALKQVRRAIFLYRREPCFQLASLFHRRNYPVINCRKKQHIPNWPPVAERPLHCKYMQEGLSRYLEHGDDQMLFEEQWLSWTRPTGRRLFPILAVQFESLWEKERELKAFLGVDPNSSLHLPERHPDKPYYAYGKSFSECVRHPMYARLRKLINETPPLQIV